MAVESRAIEKLANWLAEGASVVVVRVKSVKGSAPREDDAVMGVTATAMAGTIGGGQIEWRALEHARAILAGKTGPGALDIALGPEIGQCCGGRVELDFSPLDGALMDSLAHEARETERDLSHVLVFGAGHTGKALATALAPLPVRTMLVDSRPQAFGDFVSPVAKKVTALPEEAVHDAPANSAFVTMTHEHSLDFLITAEALKRNDAAYVGMIGSATKRAVFLNWLKDNGYGHESGDKLICPIGGRSVKDKRPEVIAALTAAEILGAVYAGQDTRPGN
ncbi:MAG: xanthine dehydrogenase accessory protein XdhC [Salaquimonas sp.]|nr:xanthine dehydrogenase accessory protein XdhC [Salaquimonas sp.]